VLFDPTVVENHHQNNIEILPQHRIYPNNSPINLIPFTQEKPQQGMKGRNGNPQSFECLLITI
jgi:hypothetical protein